MHTKDMLADALQEVGLDAMAAQARTGYYHDFLSPLALPEMALITALGTSATRYPDRADAIEALRRRVIDGEFDASAEESDDWANSEEGRDTFNKLLGDKT